MQNSKHHLPEADTRQATDFVTILRVTRWILPAMLSLIGFTYTAIEHQRHVNDPAWPLPTIFAIAVLSITGPVLTWFVLHWAFRTAAAYSDSQEQLAILIAVGAHMGKRLPISSAKHPDVLTAVHFLRDVRLGNGSDLTDQDVMVLGGGNVAIDCARTAVRMGAKQVDLACLESRDAIPADEQEIFEALEESISLYPSRSFTRILNNNGHITGVEAVDVSLMRFEPDGALTLETIPDTEHVLACDTVIFAIGQGAGLAFIPEDAGVGITKHGAIAVNPNTFATSHPGVFAAGDTISGTAFVIEAVAAGHKSTTAIQKYLHGQLLKTRGYVELPVIKMNPTYVSARLVAGEIQARPRVRMDALEASARRQTFEEVNLGYSDGQAQAEAARCLQCGVCSECLSCQYKCAAGAINHDEIELFEELEIGAVILASGFDVYDARLSSEYGVGRFPNVITSITGPYSGHLVRPSDRHEPKHIAWIKIFRLPPGRKELVFGCHPSDCHYREGNLRAESRADAIDLMLEDFDLEPERYR
jgi:thioredoxin reductase